MLFMFMQNTVYTDSVCIVINNKFALRHQNPSPKMFADISTGPKRKQHPKKGYVKGPAHIPELLGIPSKNSIKFRKDPGRNLGFIDLQFYLNLF